MKSVICQSIQLKLVIPILTGIVLVVLLSLVSMFQFKKKSTELAGIKAASSIVSHIQSMRRFYSKIVVPRAQKAGIQSHFEFAEHDDRIPTPATLINIFGNELHNENPGSSLRLYSLYPFRHRMHTETYDNFERAALNFFESNNKTPFFQLVDIDGRLSIRYAVPDIMQESCVGCHNNNPQSQKTDWKVGDVRGVLEVTLPVDEVASALSNKTINLAFVIVISLLFMLLLTVITYRYILIKPLKELMLTSYRIKEGDLKARALVHTDDEIGKMTLGFNSLIDHLVSIFEKTESDRDGMQGSVMKLLNEASNVEQGDLTVEAKVSDDMTGAIADSFNHMIYELRRIVKNVKDTTLQVSFSASQICNNTQNLADGSGNQAEQIAQRAYELDQIAISIQQVSENASLSASVAEQALSNAKQGTASVQNTIQAMSRILDQIEVSSSRIYDLDNLSNGIGEIVQSIADIADRTGVLALNASIEAALAGPAGLGFGTVAKEVEHLAERSTTATKQIYELVKAIQTQTNESIKAMERCTSEALAGAQVADKAGHALYEIEGVSTRLAELIQSISLAATKQAKGSENLSIAMSGISKVTQDTAQGTRQVAISVSKLAILAEDLLNSVSTFKLPEL